MPEEVCITRGLRKSLQDAMPGTAIDYSDSIWPVVHFAHIALKTFVQFAALVRPCT